MEFLTGDEGLYRPPWEVTLFKLKEKCFQLKNGKFLTDTEPSTLVTQDLHGSI